MWRLATICAMNVDTYCRQRQYMPQQCACMRARMQVGVCFQIKDLHSCSRLLSFALNLSWNPSNLPAVVAAPVRSLARSTFPIKGRWSRALRGRKCITVAVWGWRLFIQVCKHRRRGAGFLHSPQLSHASSVPWPNCQLSGVPNGSLNYVLQRKTVLYSGSFNRIIRVVQPRTVCLHVCVCACVRASKRTCVRACVCLSVFVWCVSVFLCLCACLCLCVCVCKHVYLRVCAYLCACVDISVRVQ